MIYRRYGEFHFRDYISSWFAISFLLIVIIVGFLTKLQFYFMVFPIMFLVIMMWSICRPNRERFSISGDIITKIQGRKKKMVSIPKNPIFVISYADICSPFAKYINCGNQTYLLKDRYAVSILKNMPLKIALKQLHRKYIYRYMTSTVEASFEEDQYVYSFVCNQELLQRLLTNRSCQIIIPETLRNQVSIDSNQTGVSIDIGY